MNIRNTTAKERMLKQIRQALLHKRDNPYPDFEDAPLYADSADTLDVTFAHAFTALGGHFIYCDGEVDLIESLVDLVEQLEVSKIAVWEPQLQQFLNQYGFPYVAHDDDLPLLEVGLTSCEALIARTGSIMLSNASPSGRRLSIYPPIHIVFATASQLVMDLKHAYKSVRERYPQNLPSMLTTITGTSCSNAVDYIAKPGGHGPQKLYLFLVEDRF